MDCNLKMGEILNKSYVFSVFGDDVWCWAMIKVVSLKVWCVYIDFCCMLLFNMYLEDTVRRYRYGYHHKQSTSSCPLHFHTQTNTVQPPPRRLQGTYIITLHLKGLWFEHEKPLPEKNSSPLKIGLPKRKRVFQPSIFRCYECYLHGGGGFSHHI